MRYIISLMLASASPALAQVPQVVTDIPPVHSITAAVMGDLGQPVLLLEKGASEHHFQLRPSQAGQIADAGLVVMVSPQLTPWLEGALKSRAAEAPLLTLLTTPGTELEEYDDDHAHDHAGHDHDHGHDHADDHSHDHDHGHDHAHDDHSHTGTDPHAWLDPQNGIVWAKAIAAELSRLDPENAATYAANVAKLTADIDAVDAANRALLAPVENHDFLTAHDAYGYFADHYDLDYEGAVATGDASAPGAKHLTELRADLVKGEIRCLFPEVAHDPAQLTQLAEGTTVKVGAALDPVGTMLDPGPQLYTTLLANTAQTLADCLR